MRSPIRSIFVALVCACSVWWPVVSFAQAAGLSYISYGTNGGSLVSGSLVSAAPVMSYSANSSGDVAMAETVMARVGLAANDVAMTSTRVLPWVGVARVAARALPYVGAGVALWGIWDGLGCHFVNGSVSCQAGMAQVQTYVYSVSSYPACNGGVVTAVLSCALSTNMSYQQHTNGYTYTTTTGTCTPGSNGTYTCSGWYVQQYQNGVYQGHVYSPDGTYIPGIGNTCPAYADYTGVQHPAGAPLRPDGVCPGGATAPASEDQLTTKYSTYESHDTAVQTVKDSLAAGVDPAPLTNPAVLTGPAQVAGPVSSTVTQPQGGGAPVTTTQNTYYNINYNGPLYTYTQSNVQQNPDGSTTTTTQSPQEEIKTCGLPGQPECNVKVDESGTPTAANNGAAQAVVAQSQSDATGLISQGASSGGKDTSWHFSFSLPSSCQVLTAWDGGPSINVCQWQSEIWDLMAMVWAGTTLFVCVGMVRRSIGGA